MLSRLPIIGYAIRCMNEERPKELGVLALNAAMFAAVVTMAFGYPGFITVMLALTAIASLAILASTLG